MWSFWPNEKFNSLVIDKTVPDVDRKEHQAYHWILKNENKQTPEGEEYKPEKDYLGFFPDATEAKVKDVEPLDDSSLDSLANALDMIYYVDAEGIDASDWPEHIDTSNGSAIAYGGVSQKEFSLLRKMDNQNKLILAEYNTLAYPTEPKVRVQLEELFELKFSGWIGRYFKSLNEAKGQVPNWIIEKYKTVTNQDYTFEDKEGIVLMHETGKIVVLEMDKELSNAMPTIQSDYSNMEKWELPNFVNYDYWFDITNAKKEENIISYYKVHTTVKGDSVFNANDIPKKFPAVIGSSNGSKRYYFCGDFADNPITAGLVYFKGANLISKLLKGIGLQSERKNFFWNYYRPLILNILEDYKSSKEADSDQLTDQQSVDTISMDSQPEIYGQDTISTTIAAQSTIEQFVDVVPLRNNVLENKKRYNVGGRQLCVSEEEEAKNSIYSKSSQNNYNDDTSNSFEIEESGGEKNWRIVIASLQSESGVAQYLKELNNPEISAVRVDYLNTNRITFGPFSDLREAQLKYQIVLQEFPEAWMIKF